MADNDDKELNHYSDNIRMEAKASPQRSISPEQQATENRKRHRKNDTTPPPELGQNLNA